MIYLDNAATSYPKPPVVIKAAVSAMMKCGNPGRSGHPAALTGGKVMFTCRERLCQLFHTDDETRYTFCLNCTDALNMGIKGILKPGAHVVTTALEHNSVLRPLTALQSQGYITYSVVLPGPDGTISPADIENSFKSNTQLVAITHASNATGTIQPIKEIIDISHANGVRVLVDGAQAAGKFPINLPELGADLYAFPGHKGLLGPMGSGVLYTAPNCEVASYRQGGTGSASMCLYQPNDLPDRLESGTPAVSAISGLAAGIYIVEKNLNTFWRHCKHLTTLLYDQLSVIPEVKLYSPRDNNAGVILFSIKDIPSYIFGDRLTSAGIACRIGFHCAPLCHRHLGTYNDGAIRFSIGPYNTDKEILETTRIVKRIINEIKPL